MAEFVDDISALGVSCAAQRTRHPDDMRLGGADDERRDKVRDLLNRKRSHPPLILAPLLGRRRIFTRSSKQQQQQQQVPYYSLR